ncbi:MAG: hypothetical protein PHT91_01120 [Candidatus Nanoarchaeia archaeon]|nr:hypothetical protein [Candidatus Nanoarchaeia archaeon]MDD5054041.1 hypothetical protein [Candidatus Nanoarchaeia archaeon]MDD5499459.1 hypothetical protein [Candidatus Nanoarchaeia archaeon]
MNIKKGVDDFLVEDSKRIKILEKILNDNKHDLEELKIKKEDLKNKHNGNYSDFAQEYISYLMKEIRGTYKRFL